MVLFDFYGVFMPDPYDNWLRANGLERTGEFADIVTRLDRGIITSEEFLNGLSELTGRIVQEADLHPIPLIADSAVVVLAQELSNRYSIGLLSNASSTLRPILLALDLDKLFDNIFISSEMNLSKPQPEIFHAVLGSTNMTPDQIVFIDDKAANVIAAQNMGITSFIYAGVSGLRQQLREAGVAA